MKLDLKLDRRRLIKLGFVALGLVVLLALSIDDWGRDLISHEASVSSVDIRPPIQHLLRTRSRDQLVAAVKMAAGRIRNWRPVGEIDDGETVRLMFVRTNRLLRTTDDVTLSVAMNGNRPEIKGNSRARLGIGDLGRNPRTLRRFYSELHAVLQGSARNPVLRPPADGV